uniref:Uncharacterized protein n=1 Tax=Anguilla anguilla TaxID=7936 RepID=A0A0E9RZY2_ANGAN
MFTVVCCCETLHGVECHFRF